MTQPSLAEILSELPKQTKFRTIFDILTSSTSMEEAEAGKRQIPREMLLEALDNIPEPPEGCPPSDGAYIGDIAEEASWRKDYQLMRECATRLEIMYEEHPYSDRYKQAGFFLKKIAESEEGTEKDKKLAALILAKAQEWKTAAELHESLENWYDASIAYERARNTGQITDLHKAVEMAKKAGDSEQAISLALSEERVGLGLVGKLWAAHVAAEMGEYETALEYAKDDTQLKGWIAKTCGKVEEALLFYEEAESYQEMATLAKEHCFEDVARRGYKGLIEQRIEFGCQEEAEKFALEGELWEDLTKLRLKGSNFPSNDDAYIAILSRDHAEKSELLQSAMEDSVENLQFGAAALFAHYLGNNEQAAKYRHIGLVISGY